VRRISSWNATPIAALSTRSPPLTAVPCRTVSAFSLPDGSPRPVLGRGSRSGRPSH